MRDAEREEANAGRRPTQFALPVKNEPSLKPRLQFRDNAPGEGDDTGEEGGTSIR